VSWYRKPADQGHASAQDNLAYMYESGKGVPQDYEAAVKWYRKAADQGGCDCAKQSSGHVLDGKGHAAKLCHGTHVV
jgi:TPR repeat protein